MSHPHIGLLWLLSFYDGFVGLDFTSLSVTMLQSHCEAQVFACGLYVGNIKKCNSLEKQSSAEKNPNTPEINGSL